jgi:hypothetical protein
MCNRSDRSRHDRAAKLEHQSAVEIEPENLASRFTCRVPHDRFFKSNVIY